MLTPSQLSFLKTELPLIFNTPPTFAQFFKMTRQHPEFPSESAIRNHFDSWNDFLRCIYGETAEVREIWTCSQEDCLAAIAHAYLEVGDPFTMKKYDSWRKTQTPLAPSRTTISKRCGSFSEATQMLDIPYRAIKTSTPEEAIQSLQAYAQDISSTCITSAGYQAYQRLHPELVGPSAIRRIYSTFTQAVEAAGLTNPLPKTVRVTREDCIVDLKKAYQFFNQPFSYLDYSDLAQEQKWCSGGTILSRFSSWNDALCEAKIPTYERMFTQENFESALNLAYQAFTTNKLSFRDYLDWYIGLSETDREIIPSPYTFLDRFGSWERSLSILTIHD